MVDWSFISKLVWGAAGVATVAGGIYGLYATYQSQQREAELYQSVKTGQTAGVGQLQVGGASISWTWIVVGIVILMVVIWLLRRG
jgi:small-conductance mechanosensitive channel